MTETASHRNSDSPVAEIAPELAAAKAAAQESGQPARRCKDFTGSRARAGAGIKFAMASACPAADDWARAAVRRAAAANPRLARLTRAAAAQPTRGIIRRPSETR